MGKGVVMGGIVMNKKAPTGFVPDTLAAGSKVQCLPHCQLRNVVIYLLQGKQHTIICQKAHAFIAMQCKGR